MSLGSCCVSGFKVRTQSPRAVFRPLSSPHLSPRDELTRLNRWPAARGHAFWQDPGHQRCLYLYVRDVARRVVDECARSHSRFGQLADISLPKGDYDKTKALLFLTECVDSM
jgi:hypothetical protein